MRITDALNYAHQLIEKADLCFGHGLSTAWEEAAMLVLFAAGLPLDSGDAVLDDHFSEAAQCQLDTLLQKRVHQHYPVAYLVKEAWFMGLPFYVDERVLIPRSPFAEWIQRGFSPWLEASRVQRVCEIGTGSGCMAIAASYVFPDAQIDAVDVSVDALAVAAINVDKHRASSRITLQRSDCFSAFPDQEQFDLILSNPPYVERSEVDALPPEYTHEPVESALYAANEGMMVVDTLLREAPRFLSNQGILVVEVGYSDGIFSTHYPDLPVTWLDCSEGGQGLFLVTKAVLEEYGHGR